MARSRWKKIDIESAERPMRRSFVVRIGDDLNARADRWVAENDSSKAQLIRRALIEFLDREESK
jgi:predicted transcriptional regulator